jgi:triacylglycerol lipase
MTAWRRWRGLAALVHDAVEHGSEAVEMIQKDYARVPFEVLEKMDPIATPAHAAHVAHDVSVSLTHRAIRIVNTVVVKTVDVALETLERRGKGGGNAERAP